MKSHRNFRRRYRSVYNGKIQIITSYLRRLHFKLGQLLSSVHTGVVSERFQKRFHLFYRFDALFTRTKEKYFHCIELAPTSAVNCYYFHPSLREINTNENARKRYRVHVVILSIGSKNVSQSNTQC